MDEPVYLDKNEFLYIVKNSPLISIDLIVKNKKGEVLLGWRNNSPARDTWFVPGGRIIKNEKFSSAFSRITKTELGQDFPSQKCKFKGVYEHIYPGENFANIHDVTTHYIVLAFELQLETGLNNLPGDQHKNYKWMTPSDILVNNEIHQNVKNYFNDFHLF